MSLHSKVAIVTGGGTGIGLGISTVLSSRGARIVIAQRNAAHLREAEHALSAYAPLLLQVDISDAGAVEHMVQKVTDVFGSVDIVVNNASLTGKPAITSFLGCSIDELNAIVDVNLKGTFYVSQIAARRMIEQGTGGSIIHISSVAAFAAQEFASVYCATKCAQVSLARGMAIELAQYNIRVNAIAPGDIYTPANAPVLDDLKTAGASGHYLRYTPLGRRGTAEEVGHAVAFLVSDEASFITGTTLVVDGGFLSY